MKALAKDIARQAKQRYEWWVQRLAMQLPRNVSTSMQVRARVCVRFGRSLCEIMGV